MKLLFILLSMRAIPAMGQFTNQTNHPLCPTVKPQPGDVCLVPKSFCYYDPYVCPGSNDVLFKTSIFCFQMGPSSHIFYDPSEVPFPCGVKPLCPKMKPPKSDVTKCVEMGKQCRYEPIGCKDGIKFATVCECKAYPCAPKLYRCTSKEIICQGNDPDCPVDPPLNQTCDPSKVDKCNYQPYDACPGSQLPPFFAYRCFCNAASKKFVCQVASEPTCNEESANPTLAPESTTKPLSTPKPTKNPTRKPTKKPSPTRKPTKKPSPTRKPTNKPSLFRGPTKKPSSTG